VAAGAGELGGGGGGGGGKAGAAGGVRGGSAGSVWLGGALKMVDFDMWGPSRLFGFIFVAL